MIGTVEFPTPKELSDIGSKKKRRIINKRKTRNNN